MSTLAWPLLLMAFGLILLAAEVFLPTGGVIGALAAGLVAWSLWMAFRQSTSLGLKFLAADLVLVPSAVVGALSVWPRMPMARRAVLKPPAPEEIALAPAGGRVDHLVGEFGRALTPLRPSGLVDFDGRRLDGLSEDGLIPRGALVQAVRVRSGRLVVRNAPAPRLDEPEYNDPS